MDDLAWLRLQVEWGADESLDDQPVDRRRAVTPESRADPTPPSPAPAAYVLRAPTPAAPTAPGGVVRAQALADAAGTIAELRDALAGFDDCALRATATHLIFSDGDPASGLVLIADVPGAAEDRAGRPFAGPAGLFLDRMFTSAGLDRAAALSTSLLPWRPPGDRKPTEAEVQLCLPFLLRHLALLKPRRVVLLGGLAARTLLPGSGRRARGVWHDLAVPSLAAPVPSLALPSPAHIQATPAAKRDSWADLLRLRRALETDPDGHI
jgi:DNA polymerase